VRRNANFKVRSFGQVILQRRRQLDLTQEKLARRVRVSAPYIGLLEMGKRRPSERLIIKLAGVLGLDSRDLFLLANPKVDTLIFQKPDANESSAWGAFVKDQNLREIHKITDQEMEALSAVAKIGDVLSSRDFVFVLNAIRQALGR
jgi:transcriptional regulator with XRE-family HTH domain